MEVRQLLFIVHRFHADREARAFKIGMLVEDNLGTIAREIGALENADRRNPIFKPRAALCIAQIRDIAQDSDFPPTKLNVLVAVHNQRNRAPLRPRHL